MKRLLLIAALLLTSGRCYAGTWALVQTVDPGTTACSPTCNITVASTGSGHLMILIIESTSLTDTVSSVANAGTWNLCATSGCHSTQSTNHALDGAYNLSTTSGVTTIAVTMSATGAIRPIITEYSTTAGPAVLDVVGIRAQASSSGSPTGVALTLSGANDVIVQAIDGSAPTAISGTYTNPSPTISVQFAAAGSINTASGAAPTWTQTSSLAALLGMAFKETAAVTKVQRRR